MAAIMFNTRYDNKYFNADGSDITASIATVTAKLNEATSLYSQAMTAIAACDNSSTGCLEKTGRHISTWRDQRDRYAPLVTQYKGELTELLALQRDIAASTTQSAQSNQVVAEAQTALAKADSAKTMSGLLKWSLIIGGILVVVIGGIFIFKKLKK